jgi:hypothetical protein
MIYNIRRTSASARVQTSASPLMDGVSEIGVAKKSESNLISPKSIVHNSFSGINFSTKYQWLMQHLHQTLSSPYC